MVAGQDMRTVLGGLLVMIDRQMRARRPASPLAIVAAGGGAGFLGGCAADRPPPAGEPTMYVSMAAPDAELDAAAAASMLSGYRANNGLTAVTVDPDLMKLADQQARAMASHYKLDQRLI